MKVLTYPGEEAETRIDQIVNRSLSYPVDLEHSVVEIIKAVQAEGDAALLRYTRQFDAPRIKLEELKVSDSEMEEAAKQVDPEFSGLVHEPGIPPLGLVKGGNIFLGTLHKTTKIRINLLGSLFHL